jgi:2-polyprenyl-3-methyl-5-hydroxy-6-metoxy-1,4-benzoquinol methylase
MPVCAGKSAMVPCALCGAGVFKPALDCEDFSFVRCKSCGLVQRNPQPVKEEIIARYSDTFGKDYLAYEIENEDAFLKLQQLALKDAGFYKLEKTLLRRAGGPSVLDIGCATGALLAALRDRGWRVTGVEISPCSGYARDERKLDVRSLPLEENEFPEASFDAVLASHLIEHLNDPRSFLTETRRILKDNGVVFITTPNISGFQARLYGGQWRSAIFDHLYLFSIRTLSNTLKSAGFKVEKIRTWGGLAAGLAPTRLKKTADFLAKRLGFGDVMIVRAKKM